MTVFTGMSIKLITIIVKDNQIFKDQIKYFDISFSTSIKCLIIYTGERNYIDFDTLKSCPFSDISMPQREFHL